MSMKKSPARARDTYHVGNLGPRLLEVARRTLEEAGPLNLSIRAVAKEVGVSPTASYHHFATRKELLGHLAAQGFRELHDALNALGGASDRGSDLLERACVVYVDFARRNPALYQVMFGPELAGKDVVVELHTNRTAAFEQVKRILGRVIGPSAKPAEVQRAATGTWSYTHGLASLWVHRVLQLPDNTTVEQLVGRTLRGLAQVVEAAKEN
ncbi:TetR/AcrR family transcriptional regulator [Myxococcus sp. 1LA]